MPQEPILTTGRILSRHSERAFLVSLPNGKKIIAHPHRNLLPQLDELTPESQVTLEMTPFDFDKARISAILPPASES